MNSDLMFSSDSGEWQTPPELFAKLDAEFGFNLDVAASHINTKCARYFDGNNERDDGLTATWGSSICWMNPPYGRQIGRWVAKAWSECVHGGATVVCLLPARTDTKWWHDHVINGGAEIRFLRGRVNFIRPGASVNDKRQPAPFPSAVVIFRPNRATHQ